MKAVLSIFPKFYRHLDVASLASLVRDVGLDTTNLVVRDGYWVSESELADELPKFVRIMHEEGLKIQFATTGYSPQALLADPSPLALFAEYGIKEFRIAYFRTEDNPRVAIDAARSALAALARLCEKYDVRAVYQVHHGTLIPSPSAAWHIVHDIPAKCVGIELDPGNQSFEGFECWDRSANLLGSHLVAVGVKDTVPVRDMSRLDEPSKGWRRDWAPIYEGVTNWHEVVRALKAIDFTGTMVFMPFYDENDPSAMTVKLKREVAYLRTILAQVESEE